MSVGCHGGEYDGGREFVHVSVPGTILGTAREGLGSGWPVQRMSRTCVGSKILSRELASTTDVADRCRRYVARKINKSIECRVCRRRCLLFVELFDTDDGNESNAARLDRYRDGIDNNHDNQPMYILNREGTNKGSESVRLDPNPKRRQTTVLKYFVDNKQHMGA
jgi:hypothetical protein